MAAGKKRQNQAPAPAERPGGATVTVALCHPHGIKFVLRDGAHRVFVNGNASNLIGQNKGVLPSGGFGLTEIKAEEWEEIKRVYGRMRIFKNGLIFAHEKPVNARAEADEKAGLRHGREPVAVEGKNKSSRSEPFDGKEG